MDWESFLNILDYRIRERHVARWHRALAQWWQRWRTCAMAGRHAHEARQQIEERTRMKMEVIEKAKAKTIIGELDEPFLNALQEELYTKWHGEFVAKARKEIEPEYEAKYQRQCERWHDEHAGFKRTLQDEYDSQREHDRTQDRRRIREEFAERFETAKEAQETAEQRLVHSDEQILMLIKTLLPEGKKPFLYDCGVETVDVWGLNSILHRHQLQIRHELTESQRLVKVRTGEAAWGTATRFWLAPYEAPQEPMIDGISASKHCAILRYAGDDGHIDQPSRHTRPDGALRSLVLARGEDTRTINTFIGMAHCRALACGEDRHIAFARTTACKGGEYTSA
jgi:hypothetical protein